MLRSSKVESSKTLITVTAETTVREVMELTERRRISGVPVIEGDNNLVGIVTSRDLRFETNHDQPVSKIMTPKAELDYC